MITTVIMITSFHNVLHIPAANECLLLRADRANALLWQAGLLPKSLLKQAATRQQRKASLVNLNQGGGASIRYAVAFARARPLWLSFGTA